MKKISSSYGEEVSTYSVIIAICFQCQNIKLHAEYNFGRDVSFKDWPLIKSNLDNIKILPYIFQKLFGLEHLLQICKNDVKYILRLEPFTLSLIFSLEKQNIPIFTVHV